MLLPNVVSLVRVFMGTIILFVVPGYLILFPWRQRLKFTTAEAICAASGLSLAVIPLSLYIFTMLGLRQTAPIVIGLLVSATAVLALLFLVRRRRAVFPRSETGPHRRPRNESATSHASQAPHPATHGALAIIFLATLIGRLWSVRDIHYPLWTDSYGHTLIAALVEQSGQIPVGYEPFAPIHDFTYHFGFHTIAVWTHWVTGLDLPRSVVVAGQVINALVVPTTFLFAGRLFRNIYAGLTAALIAGLLSHMPSQFVNWGRYTQLCGQMLLPVALTFWIELLRPHVRSRNVYLILCVLAFSGLFVVHYRIFIFAFLFALPAFLFALVSPEQGSTSNALTHLYHRLSEMTGATDTRYRRRILFYAILAAVATLLLLTPWIDRLMGGFGARFAEQVVQGFDRQDHGEYFDANLRFFTQFGAHTYLLVMAAVGAVWGVVRRNRYTILMIIWLALLFITANLHLVGVTPFYSTTIVVLSLYLPVSVLIGYLGGRMIPFFSARALAHLSISGPFWQKLVVATSLLALMLVGLYTIRRDATLIAPDNAFVRPADEQAMVWIRHSIPDDALFYIVTTFWTPHVAHGLDAGYWLPLLARRQTIMPLQKYASDGEPIYTDFINERLRSLDAAQDTEELWRRLRAYSITHIYIGARETELDPEPFLALPGKFPLLYNEDDVWIFAIAGS